MKRQLKVNSDGHPVECPQDDCRETMRENDDPIAISNIDGYECCDCGCWFEANNGAVEWAYESTPVAL